MLAYFYKLADGLSLAASRLADLSVAVLVCAMIYEVAARYLFHAPTVWAFDIAYMSNGAIFLLGVSWVLRQGAHIRIDVVRNRLPAGLVRVVENPCLFTRAVAFLRPDELDCHQKDRPRLEHQ